jgi:hypothetical protein
MMGRDELALSQIRKRPPFTTLAILLLLLLLFFFLKKDPKYLISCSDS